MILSPQVDLTENRDFGKDAKRLENRWKNRFPENFFLEKDKEKSYLNSIYQETPVLYSLTSDNSAIRLRSSNTTIRINIPTDQFQSTSTYSSNTYTTIGPSITSYFSNQSIDDVESTEGSPIKISYTYNSWNKDKKPSFGNPLSHHDFVRSVKLKSERDTLKRDEVHDHNPLDDFIIPPEKIKTLELKTGENIKMKTDDMIGIRFNDDLSNIRIAETFLFV